jgi:esterase
LTSRDVLIDVSIAMLTYTTRGAGPRAVLVLHGFLGSGRNLASLAQLISARLDDVKLVLPDLLGHGTSPPLTEGADLDTLAEAVLALSRSLSVAKFEIIGHSMGGRVALAIRRAAPNEVGRIVLLDVSPARLDARASELDAVMSVVLAAPAEAGSREQIASALAAGALSPGLVNWLAMNIVPKDGRWSWRIDRARLAELLPRTRSDDLWSIVEREPAEVLLVRGARSAFVTDEDEARMKRIGGDVVTIADAGHFLHVERPKAVADAVAAHLARRL